MKEMKYLPVMIVCVIMMSICYTIFSLEMQDEDGTEKSKSGTKVREEMITEAEEDDEEYDESITEHHVASSWVCPPKPKFLENYYGKADISADTICVVNGNAYYYGFDERYRNMVIYTLDEMLCENPTLTYYLLSSSSKTKFVVRTAFKSLTVDFADRKSIAQLKELMPEYSSVRRFCKDYAFDRSRSSYRFEIDFPKKLNKFNDNIRKWLIWLIEDAYNYGIRISSGNDVHSSFRKIKYNGNRYEGNIRDVKALGKHASYVFVEGMEKEFDDDPMYIPLKFGSMSLRLVSTNGKYFSYQRYKYDYGGGVHGYPTQEIISFDPENNEEIDWDYLFKNNDDKILSLFYKAVHKDRHYQEWEDKSLEEIKKIFETGCDEMVEGNLILPTPGLTDEGVVFSFQPYYLSCFAAGCFHFTIPYKDLEPYMTENAKRLLNLKNSPSPDLFRGG